MSEEVKSPKYIRTRRQRRPRSQPCVNCKSLKTERKWHRENRKGMLCTQCGWRFKVEAV